MRRSLADAWIFLSTVTACREGNPAALTDIFAAADWINHALPTDSELIGGMNRLLLAGLVAQKENGFVTTDDGQALLAPLEARRYTHDQLDYTAALLDELEEPVRSIWRPLPQEVKAAADQYVKRMKKEASAR
jgi:hypothetical protein